MYIGRAAARAISTAAAEPRLVGCAVAQSGRSVSIDWSDGHRSEFHAMWLQDNCASRTQGGTGQRMGNACEVDPSVRAAACSVGHGGETIDVTWESVATSSRTGAAAPPTAAYGARWLRRHCHGAQQATRAAVAAASASQRWCDELEAMPGVHVGGECERRAVDGGFAVPGVDFASLAASDSGEDEDGACETRDRAAFAMTAALATVGLCVVRDAPLESDTVLRVAECIATPQPTLYPLVFDVKTEANPVNIAYTSLELRPHMDLAYYESPPGIQMLHCLRFDAGVRGGGSVFVHAHRVAEELRRRDPDAFRILTRVPATFQKDHVERENPSQMFYRRPHIVTNGEEEVTSVFWAPPFEGPLSAPLDEVEGYYAAYRALSHLIDDVELGRQMGWRVEFSLRPGEVAVFNQRQILHGRAAFECGSPAEESTGGERHFQGCYVNIDDFLNRYRVLQRIYDPARRKMAVLKPGFGHDVCDATHVGNNSA